MAGASQVQRNAGFLGRCNDFLVTDGAAGLDYGLHAGVEKHLQTIGEWEEGVGSCEGALGAVGAIGQGIGALDGELDVNQFVGRGRDR